MDKSDKNKIIELWQKGETGAFIANLLGLTRNQVIGFVYRSRKKDFASANTGEEKTYIKRPPGPKKKEKDISVLPKKKKPKKKIKVEPEYFEEPSQQNIGIDDLKYYSCRYIVKDGNHETTEYCGKTIHRVSYCKEHYAICYMPTRHGSKESLNV